MAKSVCPQTATKRFLVFIVVPGIKNTGTTHAGKLRSGCINVYQPIDINGYVKNGFVDLAKAKCAAEAVVQRNALKSGYTSYVLDQVEHKIVSVASNPIQPVLDWTDK